MTDMIYRVGRLQPSTVLTQAHFLRAAAVSPAVPTYVRTVRSGRMRARVKQVFQVMPGFIFIPEHQATRAEALLGQVGKRMNWLRCTMTHDYARCSTTELRPVFEWGRQFSEPEAMPPEVAALRVGQRVNVVAGPLAGMSGHVLRGDPTQSLRHVRIEIDKLAMKLVLPIDQLEAVK